MGRSWDRRVALGSNPQPTDYNSAIPGRGDESSKINHFSSTLSFVCPLFVLFLCPFPLFVFVCSASH
jgi:hypothetical protein